ncbi:MAG: hypothetical protein MUC95_09315 [Spirochaetes bacterium]|nr:hypothetical protein [Spirochaetota bacterium]
MLLFTACLILMIFLTAEKYKLGLVRYFDVDEVMYPNWSYHVLQGQRPYIDFMLITTPLYILSLIPIFIFQSGTDPIITARIFAFVVSLFSALSLIWLFWEMRKSWTAIFAGLLYLVSPMPSDKFLEIRPDNLAMLLFLIGLILQVKSMKKISRIYSFFSGFLYTMSFLTVQKTVPYILISVAFFIFQKLKLYIRGKKDNSIQYFMIGLSLPLLMFILWALTTGKPGLIFYSIFKLPIEAAQMFKARDLRLYYFYPNISYYGSASIGLGIIYNHAVWILGIIMAFIRLINIPLHRKKNSLQELLIPILLISSLVSYYFSPINFPQYLIPAGIFICICFTDLIFALWIFQKKKILLNLIFTLLIIAFIYISYKTSVITNWPKYGWDNKTNLSKYKRIYDLIPKNEYILDLEGSTIYYPYPYYVCCLPFEDFRHYMSISLPSIRESLIKTNTKYIYQGPYDSIRWLSPDDKKYIYENYENKENGELWIKKKFIR